MQTLSIIGVGLLGGSIGLAAKKRLPGLHVIGYGHRASTLQRALKLKAIDEAAPDLSVAVQTSDLIILCTPVGQFGQILSDIRPYVPEHAIVTDVGSTKESVVKTGEKLLGKRFVGSHPMAGSEKRGVDYASSDLFENALCILTPTRRTSAASLKVVGEFWKKIGCRLTKISPSEHDRMLAEVSHLPHVLAAALTGIPSRRATQLSGKGFLDTTRIAAGDGTLWRDILLDNGENVVESIQKLQKELDSISKLITKEEGEKVRGWLDKRKARREKLGNG